VRQYGRVGYPSDSLAFVIAAFACPVFYVLFVVGDY